MIDATTEPVPADVNEAARKIAQAMKHAESAEQCVDNESAYILLYSAVHKALAAVLISIGLRVGSGERGHVESAVANRGEQLHRPISIQKCTIL